LTGEASAIDHATEWALRIAGALPRRAARRVRVLQHRSAAGRRATEVLTHPIRHRDMRVLSGRMRGARINLAGSYLGFLTGDAEPEVQRALQDLVEPGQVVYDVGANIGFFTLLLASLVGPDGNVFAFEPMPDNAVALRHNIALNSLDNVTVVEKAVSSGSGTAQLLLSPHSAFHSLDLEGASKRDVPGPKSGEISVETITLDEFVAADPARAPDLIKLDVEGAEVIALEGMRRVLESAQPLLLCELHGTHDRYRDFVDSIQYEARIIDAESPRHDPVNPHTLAWPHERDLQFRGAPV
jgi:FkbM family methyltransferase